MLSTPVFDAASISSTSIDLPAAISWQDGHSLQGVDRRTLCAVQPFGQDSGRCRLPDAPRTGEQVGVTDPIHLDGVLQGLDDRFLADHFFENLRAKFPGDDLIFH